MPMPKDIDRYREDEILIILTAIKQTINVCFPDKATLMNQRARLYGLRKAWLKTAEERERLELANKPIPSKYQTKLLQYSSAIRDLFITIENDTTLVIGKFVTSEAQKSAQSAILTALKNSNAATSIADYEDEIANEATELAQIKAQQLSGKIDEETVNAMNFIKVTKED